MSKAKPKARRLHPVHGTLVTGDFIIDQHIYEGGRYHYADRSPGVLVKLETGGAGKLADLLKVLFKQSQKLKLDGEWNLLGTPTPARVAPPESRDENPEVDSKRHQNDAANLEDAPAIASPHRGYAFWRQLPVDAPKEQRYWQCTEKMGFGAIQSSSSPTVTCLTDAEGPESADGNLCRLNSADSPCASWPEPDERPANPAMIVIAEGGMGFRENHACWQDLPLNDARHIILKTASDPTGSDLWKHLTATPNARRTVIISAAELRLLSAQISDGLTWEQTFQDLLRELEPNGRLNELKNCHNLVVSFDSEAALAVQMTTPGVLDDAIVTFVLHASAIEEDTKNDTQGSVFGLLTCFAAAVTHAIAQDLDNPDFSAGIEAGLSAMQNLVRQGHGPAGEPPNGFPLARISKVILNPKDHFTRVSFPYKKVSPALTHGWSFLGLAESTATTRREAAFGFARLTAIYGPVALANLPHLRIGKLLTVDGEEVTALRNLRQILRGYVKRNDGKPLSIGVFGPPGAGKSFAVKQIATHLLKGNGEWLEFNLSQFDGPSDLIGAFHQIRDVVLQGKLPIAFFDEFDSRQYQWLQYLLAPMQDGKFQEGKLTHAVGKCIFIFAGGTSWTYDTFGPPEPPSLRPDGTSDNDFRAAGEAYSKFRLAKGPDFQSRLDAYLNVVGPNPRVKEAHPPFSAAKGDPEPPRYRVGDRIMEEDDKDIWWPVRRALMLRSTLKLDADTKIDIDPGLLEALLRVPRYRHGSRSMEKVLVPIHNGAGGSGKYRISYVPHNSQLDLHTDAGEFLKLLAAKKIARPADPVKLSPATQALIADRIHDAWNDIAVRDGKLKPQDCHTRASELAKCDKAASEIEAKILANRQGPARGKTRDESALAIELAELVEKQNKNEAQRTTLKANLEAAGRTSDLLREIGLCLIEDHDTSPSEKDLDFLEVGRQLEFHMELLASEEHRGWMKALRSNGWIYHSDDKREERHHQRLKQYSDLPEPEKAKDRTMIRNLLKFLKGTPCRVRRCTSST